MDSTAIKAIASNIVDQASTGSTPEGLVKNTLSPHLERFIFENFRALLIKTVSEVELKVHNEITALKASFEITETEVHGKIENTLANVLSHIRNIVKEDKPNV